MSNLHECLTHSFPLVTTATSTLGGSTLSNCRQTLVWHQESLAHLPTLLVRLQPPPPPPQQLPSLPFLPVCTHQRHMINLVQEGLATPSTPSHPIPNHSSFLHTYQRQRRQVASLLESLSKLQLLLPSSSPSSPSPFHPIIICPFLPKT